MAKPALKLVAVDKNSRTKYEIGAIWDNDGRLNLSPSKEARPDAKYPTLRLAVLDQTGRDVTDTLYLNVYDNRNQDEDL